jgi:hypothetical protein
MAALSPEEQEAVLRRMEEICAQVLNLRELNRELTFSDRAQLCARLTREWVANYRRLRDRE